MNPSSRIVLSPGAAESIKSLPNDRTLLLAIWRHVEEAASDPEKIKPPAFPFRWPMLNFPAYDSSGQMWAVTILVRQKTEAGGESVLEIITIHAGHFPDGEDPDEFFA